MGRSPGFVTRHEIEAWLRIDGLPAREPVIHRLHMTGSAESGPPNAFVQSPKGRRGPR